MDSGAVDDGSLSVGLTVLQLTKTIQIAKRERRLLHFFTVDDYKVKHPFSGALSYTNNAKKHSKP